MALSRQQTPTILSCSLWEHVHCVKAVTNEPTGMAKLCVKRQPFRLDLVPLARLERARLATIDFESIASTIPPQGHGAVR